MALALVGFLLPLFLGQLLEQVALIPLKVPMDATPLSSVWQAWTLGSILFNFAHQVALTGRCSWVTGSGLLWLCCNRGFILRGLVGLHLFPCSSRSPNC